MFWPRRGGDSVSAAGVPDRTAQDGQIGQGADAVSAVQVLGDPEPVQDGGPPRPAVEAGRGRDVLGGYAGQFGGACGRVLGEHFDQFVEARGTVTQEVGVGHALGDQHVRETVEQRDVGARPGPQVDVHLVREAHLSGVGHDQRSPSQRLLEQSGSDDGVGFDRVGPDDQEAVCLPHIVERIGASGPSERCGEACCGRGVAEPGAVVDVVRPHDRAQEFLDEVVLLVGGPGRRDRGHGIGSARLHSAAQPVRDSGQSLFPTDRFEAAVLPDQRVRQAFL